MVGSMDITICLVSQRTIQTIYRSLHYQQDETRNVYEIGTL